MNSTYPSTAKVTSRKIHRKRDEISRLIQDFEQVKHQCSQRQFAKRADVPRTTLQHWLARKDSIDQSPALTAFFESPDGLAFMHRLITAAHLEFTKNGAASIHNVSNFLKMIGLSAFAGTSYSSQRKIAGIMDESISTFGEEESERLGQNMPSKVISICEDETFHPETCLVAIEPSSNFILVEKYADDRKTATWDKAVECAVKKMPVEIIQVVSDQGRSLVCHALKSLKVHHSPDCFHVIYEIGKGTSAAMASMVKKAKARHEEKIKLICKAVDCREKYDNAPKRPRGRRPDFENRIHLADVQVQKAKEEMGQLKKDQETVRDAKAQIGQVYHPYDLKSGKKQSAEEVSRLLNDTFDTINGATRALSDKCHKKVAKAQRVTKEMVATISFFHMMVDILLRSMNISADDRQLMETYLIPGYYLKQAAMKHRDITVRNDIEKKARELLSVIDRLEDGSLKTTGTDLGKLKKAAQECAQFFQRSSSCVEGRNAQLSLRHQGIDRLSKRHLKALTVVHNYYIKRRDGTTAAERFFESKHRNLFDFLLENMDYPVRPKKYLKVAA